MDEFGNETFDPWEMEDACDIEEDDEDEDCDPEFDYDPPEDLGWDGGLEA